MAQAGGSESSPGLDTDLLLLYRGHPANVTRDDVDILIMKDRGWSYYDLLECPPRIRNRIRQHMRAESEAQKKHNQGSQLGAGQTPGSNNAPTNAFGLMTARPGNRKMPPMRR